MRRQPQPNAYLASRRWSLGRTLRSQPLDLGWPEPSITRSIGRESPAKSLSGFDQWNGDFPPKRGAPIREPPSGPEPIRRSLLPTLGASASARLPRSGSRRRRLPGAQRRGTSSAAKPGEAAGAAGRRLLHSGCTCLDQLAPRFPALLAWWLLDGGLLPGGVGHGSASRHLLGPWGLGCRGRAGWRGGQN